MIQSGDGDWIKNTSLQEQFIRPIWDQKQLALSRYDCRSDKGLMAFDLAVSPRQIKKLYLRDLRDSAVRLLFSKSYYEEPN